VCTSPRTAVHAAGVNYTMAVNRVGAAAIIMRKFNAETVLRLIEPTGSPTPSSYRQCCADAQAAGVNSGKVRRIELAVCASCGGTCPVDVKHRMIDWFGPIIHEYYGGTEGFAGTTIGPEEWLAHPGSVEYRWLGARRRRRRRRASVGQPGELYFEGGPDFEYFKDPPRPRRSTTNAVALARRHGLCGRGRLHVLTDRSTFMIVSAGQHLPQRRRTCW